MSEFVLEIGGRVRNVKAREIEGEASVTGSRRRRCPAESALEQWKTPTLRSFLLQYTVQDRDGPQLMKDSHHNHC